MPPRLLLIIMLLLCPLMPSRTIYPKGPDTGARNSGNISCRMTMCVVFTCPNNTKTSGVTKDGISFHRYFVSSVLQFQLHRALCTRTGQYIPGDAQYPLHKCDIYRNPEAGRILTRIMERGSSVPWTQLLEEVLGESRLDGTALREYFQPLEDWLRSENLRTGEYVGWSYDGDYCKFSIETAGLQVYGGFYNSAPAVQVLSLLTLMITSTVVTILTTFHYR